MECLKARQKECISFSLRSYIETGDPSLQLLIILLSAHFGVQPVIKLFSSIICIAQPKSPMMNFFPLNETRKFSGLQSPKYIFSCHSFTSIFNPWNRYMTNAPITSSNSFQFLSSFSLLRPHISYPPQSFTSLGND